MFFECILIRFLTFFNVVNLFLLCPSVPGVGQGTQGGTFTAEMKQTYLWALYLCGKTYLYLPCLRWVWWTNAARSVPRVPPHVPQRSDPHLYSNMLSS